MKLQKNDHKYDYKKIVGLSLLFLGCCSATYTISNGILHILQLQDRLDWISSCTSAACAFILMFDPIHNIKTHKPSINELQQEMDSPSPLQKNRD